jgi:lipopolysaccharide export system ATP-binding protein
VLTASGLFKSFQGRTVVRDVHIAVKRGEVVGLLGRNGAGKTTVFSMLVGLLVPDKGRIVLDDHELTALPLFKRARFGISYLPQQPSIFRGLTVEQNIMLVLEMHEDDGAARKRQLQALLNEFGLLNMRDAMVGNLSGGERRRCEIARALASKPSIILLDEPFSGLDPIIVGDIRKLVIYLTQRGLGVLLTDHNVRDTLALVNRAYVIDSGRVLANGPIESVIVNDDVRELFLGKDFTL